MVRGLTSATIVPTASSDNGEGVPSLHSQTTVLDEEEGTRNPDSTIAELQSNMYLEAAFNGQTSEVHSNVSDLPSFADTSTSPSTLSSANGGSSSTEHSLAVIADQQKPVVPLKGKLLRRRSQSTVVQKQNCADLTKNYMELARDFRQLLPYTRRPDGKYPADTLCVYCVNARPTSVFFPCQHMCVCIDCIELNNISTNYTSATDWCACPVCMADIRLIPPRSGREEEKYWQWVLEIKPPLPSHFKQEFKEVGRRLSNDATPTRGRRRSITTMFRREPNPREEGPKGPETPKNLPNKQKFPSSVAATLGSLAKWQTSKTSLYPRKLTTARYCERNK